MAEHLSVTPSGVGILFEDGEKDPVTKKGKKRCYTIARLEAEPGDVTEYVREHGTQLPSVTTILGIIDKPGLQWAAEKLTVKGCVKLAQNGELPQNPEAALGKLWHEGLRFRQVWDSKADRGKLSHEDLVHLAEGRALPALDSYPEDQRKFAQGLASFLADFRPAVLESETMVASLEHGYSGRPDLVATLGITQLPDGSGPAPLGRGLLDLKTHDKMPRTKAGKVKTPYPENLLQLGLYEIARRESGYERTDWQAVVAVDSEGNYDFTVSWLEPEAALDFLPAYKTFKLASSRVKTAADQRPVGFDQAELAA